MYRSPNNNRPICHFENVKFRRYCFVTSCWNCFRIRHERTRKIMKDNNKLLEKPGEKRMKKVYKNCESRPDGKPARDLSLSTSERERGTLARYVACHCFIPSGLSQSGHFSPSSPFLLVNDANWCMARDWSDCTYTKGILVPRRGRPVAATSRGKNSTASLRKTVHGVSPNSAAPAR